jgi:zinc protease
MLIKILVKATFLLVMMHNHMLLSAQDSTEIRNGNKLITDDNSIAEGLTAKDVIEIYLKAIGGREKLKSVKDRTTIMLGDMMGQTLNIFINQKAPNKLRQSIRSGEMKQTLIYDGIKGEMIVGDKKIKLEGKELDKLKADAEMNFLFNPAAYGVTLELTGIENVDSTKCYKIAMLSEGGAKWDQFYSIESGLKFREDKEYETPDTILVQETYYSDYRDVDGLKFPFKMKQIFGSQLIDLTVISIKINQGLEDIIFEIRD